MSVIVPIYNKRVYLENCIESILKWGGYGYDVILVDDGSTDGSGDIADGYSGNDNIIVLHQENSGVSAARNTGLQAAKGEYITFVDADDEVVPGSLDQVMLYLTGDDDICIAGAIREGRDTTPIFTDTVFENDGAKDNAALLFILTSGTKEHRIPAKATQFMSGCKEKFYRRSFIEAHGLRFDTELGRNEDVLWSCYCYYLAGGTHFLPVTVYINKEDPNGITRGMNIQKTVDNASAFAEKFNAFFQDKLDAQILGNFYFHQAAIVNYEVYRALKLKRINASQFRFMMKKWYALEANQFMKKYLHGSELSLFKRIAFYLMKLRLYRLVGFEMSVHHRYK